MKFKINNRNWKIIETTQEEMQRRIGNENGTYFGLTLYKEQEILLFKDLCQEQKRQTLLHELMHCYIGTYISLMENIIKYEEDLICDISANSHDIIHNIVENYFNKGE